MVAIRQQLVTRSKLVSSGTNPATSITVHQTGNTNRGANAAAHANLQSSGNVRAASWHWQVDDREAVQSFGHTARCWHAGTATGNNTSVAIEVCVNSDGNYARALANAAELVAYVMRQTGVSISNVVQHNRWSGKNCPQQIRAGQGGVTWSRFLDMVRAAAGSTTSPSPQPSVGRNNTSRPTADIQRLVGAVPDGIYGPDTTAKVKAWQAANGLVADGIWGPLSDAKGFGPSPSTGTLKQGDRGDRVRTLQSEMNRVFPTYSKLVVDGIFGSATAAVVREFQRRSSLVVDGIVGPATTAALNRHGIRF